MLIILTTIISIIKQTTQAVPFSNQLYGYPGMQKITFYFWQLQSIASNNYVAPPNVTVTLNYYTPTSTLPIVLISMYSVEWTGPFKINFDVTNITTTAFTCYADDYPHTNVTINRLFTFRLSTAIYQLQYYEINTISFVYTQLNTTFVSQFVTVPAHSDYQISMVMTYEQIIDYNVFVPGKNQPEYFIITSYSLNQNNVALRNYCNCSYMFKRVRLMLAGFAVKIRGLGYYNRASSYSSNSRYHDMITTTIAGLDAYTYYSAYPSHAFIGIQYLKNVQTYNNNRALIDMQSFTLSNTATYYFVVVFIHSKCPDMYPYYLDADNNCYETCPSNSILLPQSTNQFYTCKACNVQCKTCVNNQTNCSSCDSKAYLITLNQSQNTYTCICAYGYLGTTQTQCIHCNETLPSCLQCPNNTYCTKCEPTLIFNPSILRCQCPSHLTPKPYSVYIIIYLSGGSTTGSSVTKFRCVSWRTYVERCSDAVVRRLSPTVVIGESVQTGLVVFGQSCQCGLGQPYIANVCT